MIKSLYRSVPVSILISMIWANSLLAQPSVASSEHSSELTPVILIPGTSRTKLAKKENGKVIWGNFGNFFAMRRSQDELALPIDSVDLEDNRDDLVPAELMEEITIIPYLFKMYAYKNFLKRMDEVGGYQLGDIDHPKTGDNFFVFLYDWRRSNLENAKRLANRIEELKAFYHKSSMKFDIIAHCSATYMARYYALYGDKDVLNEQDPAPTNAGSQNIRKLIFVSPPHRGMAFVFRLIHEGYRPVTLPFIKAYTPLEFFSSPAFFEMLPTEDEQMFINEYGNPVDVDLYDPHNWVRYGWSVFSENERGKLEAHLRQKYHDQWQQEFNREMEKRERYLDIALRHTEAFQRAINEKYKTISPDVKLYSIILEGGSTLNLVEFSKNPGELRFDGGPVASLRFVPGDLMVSHLSMRGRFGENHPEEVYLYGQHRKMANSRDLHVKLLELLSE